MLGWLWALLYVLTASTPSPQLCLWQITCSSLLTRLVPLKPTLTRGHTACCLPALFAYIPMSANPASRSQSVTNPWTTANCCFSQLLWDTQSSEPRTHWVNCFLAMTRCCLLAPVVNGVVPWWQRSREDERCPVAFPPGACGHAIKWRIRTFFKAKVYSQLYIFRSSNACGFY